MEVSVHKDWKVSRGLKEIKAKQEPMGFRGIKGSKGSAQLERQEFKDHRVLSEIRALRVHKGMWVQQEPKELRVFRATRATLV